MTRSESEPRPVEESSIDRCGLSRTIRPFVAWALVCCACSLTAAAAAQPAPLVVVVSTTPDAPFERRLAAELSLFGYRVDVQAPAANDAEFVELLARSGGAALIAVDQARQTAEVVVADRAGVGPARRERERLDPRRRADTNAAVLAERFRARLTELGIAPAAQRSPPPGQAPTAIADSRPLAMSRPRELEQRFWVAAAIGGSSAGVGLLPEVQLELRAFPVRWLSTSAFGKVSLTTGRVSSPEGVADVRVLSGGLLIDAYPIQGPLSVTVGLGALLLDADMSGRAAPPWLGQDVSVLVPGAVVQAGTALRLSRRVSAELRGFVGACSPRVAVRIAGREVAEMGQPLLGASLGVAVGVF